MFEFDAIISIQIFFLAGYVNMDRIFLITEVHYVSEVKVNIVIGDNEDEFQLRGRIPIGFTLVRYKLGQNGVLGDKKIVKVAKWKAHWIKNQFRGKDDPLPFDPFHKGKNLYHKVNCLKQKKDKSLMVRGMIRKF